MENVSKALIIAGAILIAILLISLGILVYNSVKDITGNSTATSDMMSLEAQVSIIDMQFSKYNGVQNNTATIRKMFDEVIEYNQNNGDYEKPDENTTNYIRKISVYIDENITGIGERKK